MSHECPPAVRSKLRDQRVRKHARRIWSVDEAVRSWWKVFICISSRLAIYPTHDRYQSVTCLSVSVQIQNNSNAAWRIQTFQRCYVIDTKYKFIHTSQKRVIAHCRLTFACDKSQFTKHEALLKACLCAHLFHLGETCVNMLHAHNQLGQTFIEPDRLN